MSMGNDVLQTTFRLKPSIEMIQDINRTYGWDSMIRQNSHRTYK